MRRFSASHELQKCRRGTPFCDEVSLNGTNSQELDSSVETTFWGTFEMKMTPLHQLFGVRNETLYFPRTTLRRVLCVSLVSPLLTGFWGPSRRDPRHPVKERRSCEEIVSTVHVIIWSSTTYRTPKSEVGLSFFTTDLREAVRRLRGYFIPIATGNSPTPHPHITETRRFCGLGYASIPWCVYRFQILYCMLFPLDFPS